MKITIYIFVIIIILNNYISECSIDFQNYIEDLIEKHGDPLSVYADQDLHMHKGKNRNYFSSDPIDKIISLPSQFALLSKEEYSANWKLFIEDMQKAQSISSFFNQLKLILTIELIGSNVENINESNIRLESKRKLIKILKLLYDFCQGGNLNQFYDLTFNIYNNKILQINIDNCDPNFEYFSKDNKLKTITLATINMMDDEQLNSFKIQEVFSEEIDSQTVINKFNMKKIILRKYHLKLANENLEKLHERYYNDLLIIAGLVGSNIDVLRMENSSNLIFTNEYFDNNNIDNNDLLKLKELTGRLIVIKINKQNKTSAPIITSCTASILPNQEINSDCSGFCYTKEKPIKIVTARHCLGRIEELMKFEHQYYFSHKMDNEAFKIVSFKIFNMEKEENIEDYSKVLTEKAAIFKENSSQDTAILYVENENKNKSKLIEKLDKNISESTRELIKKIKIFKRLKKTKNKLIKLKDSLISKKKTIYFNFGFHHSSNPRYILLSEILINKELEKNLNELNDARHKLPVSILLNKISKKSTNYYKYKKIPGKQGRSGSLLIKCEIEEREIVCQIKSVISFFTLKNNLSLKFIGTRVSYLRDNDRDELI